MIPDELDNIEEKLNQYKSFRKNPKGRNCGSIFKNDGFFAGKIIDECNLKGYSVGQATISTEHANFIIAKENCTSSDIYNLIKNVKEKVYKEKQIELQEEVVYLGEF
jgi:UDP-N-acetylmuramate dehydrogenase